jgi:hypothetical protein
MRDPDLASCLRSSQACRADCDSLLAGSDPAAAELKGDDRTLVTDCADICGLAATMIERRSGRINYLCWLCAHVCRKTAELLAGRSPAADACARACRECADQCEPLGLSIDPAGEGSSRQGSF